MSDKKEVKIAFCREKLENGYAKSLSFFEIPMSGRDNYDIDYDVGDEFKILTVEVRLGPLKNIDPLNAKLIGGEYPSDSIFRIEAILTFDEDSDFFSRGTFWHAIGRRDIIISWDSASIFNFKADWCINTTMKNSLKEARFKYCNLREKYYIEDFNMLKDLVSGKIEDFNGKPIEKLDNGSENYKEEKEMNSIFDNTMNKFTFGKITDTRIKYSINGIAIRDNSGNYIAYDTNTNTSTDVSGLIIDSPVFAIPVSIKAIKKNDIICFKNNYLIVTAINDDNTFTCLKQVEGEIVTIKPEKNIFGFDYVTKIMNPFEGITDTTSEDNPFGIILPFMMINESNDMMKFFMLNQMSSKSEINPMLLYMMMNDKGGNNDALLMFMLSNNNNMFAAPARGQRSKINPVDSAFTTPLDWTIDLDVDEITD